MIETEADENDINLADLDDFRWVGFIEGAISEATRRGGFLEALRAKGAN